MTHIHRCKNCYPEWLELTKDSSKYLRVSDYHAPQKCGRRYRVLENGVDVGYTFNGVMTGQDGWYLWAGKDINEVHMCPCTGKYPCLQLIRSPNLEVIHYGLPIP